jgi:hypothetical protein
MKLFPVILLCTILFTAIKADDSKYHSAMKKNLEKFGSAASIDDYIDLANSFERIALAEKDRWLPYYYTSLSYAIAGMIDSDKQKQDSYLDKADKFISVADSLQPDESEIYALKGMIAQGMLAVDPMNRFMKYGPVSQSSFQKAAELDSLNPRPDYLIGTGVFYTPEQFGGGPQAAKPHLEKSLAKFEKFVPKDDLMPNWGKNMVEGMLSQIK